MLLLGHEAELEPDPAAARVLITEARRILDKVVGTRALTGSYKAEEEKLLKAQARLDIAAGAADPLKVMQGDMGGALAPKYLETLKFT